MGRLAFSRLQSNMNPSPSGEGESLNSQLPTPNFPAFARMISACSGEASPELVALRASRRAAAGNSQTSQTAPLGNWELEIGS